MTEKELPTSKPMAVYAEQVRAAIGMLDRRNAWTGPMSPERLALLTLVDFLESTPVETQPAASKQQVVEWAGTLRKIADRADRNIGEDIRVGTDEAESLIQAAEFLDSLPDETTAPHAERVKEIYDRHQRVSKLLWGGQTAVMLGPTDADNAHYDRGTLLSLLTPDQRGAVEPSPRRCHCGQFLFAHGMALITDEHAHDHAFDGTHCDCEGAPECLPEKASGRVRHLVSCNLNYIDSVGEGCDCGAENGTEAHE